MNIMIPTGGSRILISCLCNNTQYCLPLSSTLLCDYASAFGDYHPLTWEHPWAQSDPNIFVLLFLSWLKFSTKTLVDLTLFAKWETGQFLCCRCNWCNICCSSLRCRCCCCCFLPCCCILCCVWLVQLLRQFVGGEAAESPAIGRNYWDKWKPGFLRNCSPVEKCCSLLSGEMPSSESRTSS